MNCDSPYYVLPSKAATEKIPVPCGKCPVCKAKRVNQWVFRVMEQEKVSCSAHFVTLTYDTRHVPISNNGFMTLRKKDVQDYWKRLRKLTPDSKIKYYVCGEYGGEKNRPHYHAIVFNVPDVEMFAKAWMLNGESIGTVHVGTVTSDSIAYTMKYIDKAARGKQFARDDRQLEFSCQSNGVGEAYINDASIKYHTADVSRLYVSKLSGHKVAMPRYYRNKIFTEDQKKQQVAIIQAAVIEQEKQQRLNHNDFNGRLPYEQAVDNAKYSRHRKFYHSSKNSRNNVKTS